MSAQMCQWYARCDNPATHTQHHPVLGDVPICDRCQALYDEFTAEDEQ